MMNLSLLLLLSALANPEFQIYKSSNATLQLPSCQWCGASEAPENIDWQFKIASDDEPGERLIFSGIVYQSDGKTPAKDIIIYAYHTDTNGIYSKKGNETGNGKRHGYLRGWVKTNAQGQFQFDTIKPAAYPSRAESAHIHLTILEPGKNEYWIESTLFVGDPLISSSKKSKSQQMAEFGFIIDLVKANGVWSGTRNIRLKK